MKIPRPLPQDRGVSLVLVLFAILSISFLVVLYFSLASNDRASTAAYASSIQAEDLSAGGLELVVEELRKEITDPARSDIDQSAAGGPAVYVPRNRTFSRPEHTAIGSAGSLIKMSTRAIPIYSGTGASLLASTTSSTALSRNGRSITTARWERPVLGGFSGSTTAPDWVYLNRDGPVVDPSPAAAADTKSGGLVTGRIAFAVYEIGGLLDINVAGYPAELTAADAGRKGTAAMARLQLLGLTDPQVAALMTFRNPSSRSSYLTYLSGSNHAGFTRTVPGDNRFLSRQELIRFAKRNGFDSHLNLLTVFSREKNAPSYAPENPTANNPSLATARHAGSGRLLFENRFPLQKIALLANPDANAAEIKEYFGLEYDSSARTFQYVGPGSSTASAIKTLGQVGTEADYRTPDFFETLKAVILDGSIGQSAGDTASEPGQNSKDAQVIRIGACVIDQFDADYIPTAISFEPAVADTPIWGVENLPYVNKLQFIGQDPNPQGIFNVAEGTTRNNFDGSTPNAYRFRWAVELWNPHVRRWPASTIPSPNIKVALGPEGAQARVDIYPNSTATEAPTKKVGTPRAIAAAQCSNEFNIATGYARNAPSIASYYRSFVDPRQVFFGEVNAVPIPRDQTYTSAILNILNPMHVDLWVRGPDNFLHHYYRSGKIGFTPLKMTGNSNHVSSFMQSDPRTNRMGVFDADWRPNAGSPPPVYPATISVASRYAWPVRISTSTALADSVQSTGSAPTDLAYSAATTYPGLLYENTTAGATFADPDGVTRTGDGGFSPGSSTQVPTIQLNPNPAANPPATAFNPSRPVLLDRPFRTVGELGYAFRDGAWKSLNFSGTDSADAGLLDAFSLTDRPVTAGKFSLNSTAPEVWAAFLAGSLQMDDDTTSGLTDAQASELAEKITDFLASPANEPLGNIAELATRVSVPTVLTASVYGSTGNLALKTQREAFTRALSDSVQSRTWNLLIDLVAQTGKFSANAANLDQFVVEGEQRRWLHVAIDRYTGEIIDEQMEIVQE